MKTILDTRTNPYFEPIEGLKAKIAHSTDQTYAFWEIEKGTVLPDHYHIQQQISLVTKGELELTIDGKTTVMKKGMVALIPSNTSHSAKALTYAEITDVFSPIREDFPNYQNDTI